MSTIIIIYHYCANFASESCAQGEGIDIHTYLQFNYYTIYTKSDLNHQSCGFYLKGAKIDATVNSCVSTVVNFSQRHMQVAQKASPVNVLPRVYKHTYTIAIIITNRHTNQYTIAIYYIYKHMHIHTNDKNNR